MTDSEYLQRLLSFDSLAQAEEITGKDYKSDMGTVGLGLLMNIENEKRKEEILSANGDFYRLIDFLDAVQVAIDLGFEPIWAYSGLSYYDNPQKTIFFWHDGILLTMNDYKGRLNTAEISFNWRPFSGKSNEFTPIFSFPISGGMEHRSQGFDDVEGDPWVFVGSINVTEGLKHYVNKLRASGEILTDWYVTDDLLHVRVGDEVKTDFSDKNWHDKVKDLIRSRVSEFAEPARSAIQAGFAGKDWE